MVLEVAAGNYWLLVKKDFFRWRKDELYVMLKDLLVT